MQIWFESLPVSCRLATSMGFLNYAQILEEDIMKICLLNWLWRVSMMMMKYFT